MTSPAQHTDVGAYAIGALDPADAARFEEHLAWCEHCAVELEQLMGVGPLLAEYAQSAPDVASISARPSRELLDGMLARVAVTHRRTRRRRLYLVAAAAAAVIAAPVATYAVTTDTSTGNGNQTVASGRTLWDGSPKKIDRTDKKTGVRASIAMNEVGWGTEITTKLGNVPGPEMCDLVAVGKDGSKQTVASWKVPEDGGYDWEEARYYPGSTGFKPDEIDHFVVETTSGDRLATIPMS